MKKFTHWVVGILLFSTIMGHPLYGQRSIRPLHQPVPIRPLTHPSGLKKTSFVSGRSFYRSKANWQHIIDSTWGPGLPTATKLSVFDRYWNLVDQTWGGFPNLVINWDSLKNVYRPQVAAGVSRGRFYGILCRLTRALNEWHVYTIDQGIDSSAGYYGPSDPEYPNYPSSRYQPGMPLINANTPLFRTNIGAGITPLQDSTALVYSVMPNHPLNLQPGDVILGYNGVPLRQLIRELLDAELPILGGGSVVALMSLGTNWGLFDTIDVIKYSTNDTVHYPTSLLDTISPPYFIATEQLPVKGVPFPDIQNSKMVAWGVVEGTNIGYIYAWDWGIKWDGQTRDLFGQAVNELMYKYKVKGLILDFRTNPGGDPTYANIGFKQLFNFDPTSNYSRAIRVRGTNHSAFTLEPMYSELTFVPTPEIFDHPIAVLTGPNCGSAGDYNAFRLRFHPMVRFFGKPTAGAYTDYTDNAQYGTLTGPYYCRVDDGSLYSNYNNEGYMIHKPFSVDEEVWLTRDGVAKGEDDVVKKALEWINNSVYGHNLTKNIISYHPVIDTLKLSAIIENPNSHQVSSKIYIKNLHGNFTDSLALHKVGSSGKSETWNGNYIVRGLEDYFKLTLSTTDITDSKNFTIDNISRFTTAGPVVLDSVNISYRSSLRDYKVIPYVHNMGDTATITNASVKLICNDPWIASITPAIRTLPNITTGSIAISSSYFAVKKIDSLFPGHFNFKIEIQVDGWTYWEDSMHMVVTGVKGEDILLSAYKLEQNYPNPFNPVTTIQYQIPKANHVIIKVFDVLGREVATLVDKKMQTGIHNVQWDASRLSSGVYFYRLQAGKFIETKKLLLLK